MYLCITSISIITQLEYGKLTNTYKSYFKRYRADDCQDRIMIRRVNTINTIIKRLTINIIIWIFHYLCRSLTFMCKVVSTYI